MLGVKRVHLMGCLLLPVILLYLGILQPIVNFMF